MQTYDFTVRFDNEAHSLSAYNGIPPDEVGRILIDLTNALGKGHTFGLSEIRGNCYALKFSTPQLTTYESMKVIHKRVEENDLTGLSGEEKKYVSTLKSVMNKNNVFIDAYGKDKNDFYVKIVAISMPEKPKHYFEISSVYGKITAIGGKTLDGKANIKINEGHFDIEVTPSQEKTLLAHYKRTKLLLTIKKKIDFDSGSILSATLEDYEEVSENDFFKGIKKLSSSYPKGLFSSENDEDLLSIIRNKPEEEQIQD
ncbi:MAG: hypothetical protein JNL70_00940 [Saprospiraceae bacterium]|nr:hypothetical protein [Saprospiraceae bacterium]